MEALDSIEKRIDNLNRILGPLPDSDVKGSENLVDSLLSANTLISSAMSGRENIAKVVNRSAELETYLDPNFHDELQTAKSKEVYVNTVAPELAANFETLEKIKTLEPALGAEYFRNIPDATETLNEIGIKLSDLNLQNDLITESLILATQRYNEIQNGLTETFQALNEKIDKLEDKLLKKKNLNEDI